VNRDADLRAEFHAVEKLELAGPATTAIGNDDDNHLVGNALANTRSSIATYRIALYKSLGGGWETRQGQPVIPESMRAQMEERTNWSDLLSTPPPVTETTETAPQ